MIDLRVRPAEAEMTRLATRACSPHMQRRDRRGTALLLVLFLIVLLGAVTMSASGAARSSGAVVMTRRAQVTARLMSESGLAATVAGIEQQLTRLANDETARNTYLNSLDRGTNDGNSALGDAASDTIADGAFAIAVVDVSSRLDLNSTGEAGLARFFSSFTTAANSTEIARRLAARVRGDGQRVDSARVVQLERDSTVRALLGQKDTPSILHPFESLDELSEIPGIDAALLEKAAPLLTVDGVATINRTSAPQIVASSAGGTESNSPVRLLVISRGWQIGHALSHEIQAVYDVTPTGLTLVRWRERAI